MICGGHGRLEILKKLNIEEVDCYIPTKTLTEKQFEELNIRLNKNIAGEFDFDLLANEFEMEDLLDWGFEDFEFDIDDKSGEVEEDEVPEINESEPPKTEYGRIYQLGKHRLLCGDSTKEEDVKKIMGDDKADLYLTDPPYNVAYVGKTKDALTIDNDSMNDSNFKEFLVRLFSVADSVMKKGAAFYIWHADSEGYNFRGACFDIGWQVRQNLVWNKSCMVMGRQDYHWKQEPCLYGWKEGASHRWASDRKQTTVIEWERPSKNIEHPTMKPVGLIAYQIGNNTLKEDIVIDFCGGSGTTLIACEQLNRQCRMIEIDPKYCDVIVKRYCKLKDIDSNIVFETGFCE